MKSKSELIDSLAKIIDKYSGNKEVIKTILEAYKSKKLPLMTVGSTFKGDKPLTSLTKMELGVWCTNLYEAKGDKEVKPTDYFTEGELYDIQEYMNADEVNKEIKEIILKNVERIIIKGRVQYICPFIDYYDISRCLSSTITTYNFETQRDAKITKYHERVIRQENVNFKSVEEISDLITAGLFIPNLITWNIRKSKFNNEGVFYNEENKTLTLRPNNELEIFVDIVDGYHRSLGCQRACLQSIAEGKTLQGGFILSINNFSISEAQSYINVQNQQNAMKEEQTRAFARDPYNEFVKVINTQDSESKNVMYDKISNTLEEVELYETYTTINIMSDGFKLTGLKLDKPYENENFYIPHYIYIFNTILGYYMYKYDNNVKDIRKNTIILEPNAFIGMIALGKELYEKENKKEILNEILNSVSFDKNDYNWDSLDMYKKNPRSYKKIYDYFVNIIKEVK